MRIGQSVTSESASGVAESASVVPRAPIGADAAEPARRAEEQAAADPVDRQRVHRAAEERPHRHEHERHRRIVEDRARDRRAEHAGDSREPDDRRDRLLRASTASGDSSRSETKTARGATSTIGARSHQLRSNADAGAASLLTRAG